MLLTQPQVLVHPRLQLHFYKGLYQILPKNTLQNSQMYITITLNFFPIYYQISSLVITYLPHKQIYPEIPHMYPHVTCQQESSPPDRIQKILKINVLWTTRLYLFEYSIQWFWNVQWVKNDEKNIDFFLRIVLRTCIKVSIKPCINRENKIRSSQFSYTVIVVIWTWISYLL